MKKWEKEDTKDAVKARNKFMKIVMDLLKDQID